MAGFFSALWEDVCLRGWIPRRESYVYGTCQKESTFFLKKKKKKRILPYTVWEILQKEPLLEAGARIPPRVSSPRDAQFKRTSFQEEKKA